MSQRARQRVPRPVGIVAGAGQLPVLLARRLTETKRPVFVLGLKGLGSPTLARYPHHWLADINLDAALQALKGAGCQEVVFLGALTRPELQSQRGDKKGKKLVGQLQTQAGLGDAQLLRLIVQLFEGAGLRVRGADHFLPELLAPEGYIGAHRADEAGEDDIKHGARVMRSLARLDIGQALVVCKKQILAVEGVEGTDFLLRRIAALPAHMRGSPQERKGILIKMPTYRQERRIDMPTLGPATIKAAGAAGLAGIVCAAGRAFLLERAQCVRLADAAGMFVRGQRLRA